MKFKQSRITIIAAATFAVMTLLLAFGVLRTGSANSDLQRATDERAEFRQLALDLAGASKLLTDEVRAYAVTGDPAHLELYWREVDETKTRDRVVARLEQLGATGTELGLLKEAQEKSNGLIATETRAMRLVLDAAGAAPADMPGPVAAFELSAADRALSADAKRAKAREILFDDKYYADVASIMEPTKEFQTTLNERTASAVESAQSARDTARTILIALAILIPASMIAVLLIFHRFVGVVVTRYRAALAHRDPDDLDFAITPGGTEELHELAVAFNDQFRANQAQLRRNRELMDGMTSLIGEVTEAAGTVSSSSQQMASTSSETGKAVDEIASAIGEMAQGAERQVRMAESARESAEQTTEAARSSAENAQAASAAGEQARSVAGDGVTAAEHATEAMRAVRASSQDVTQAIGDLSERSNEIGAIVATITGIAEQTNLLALNAASRGRPGR